MWERFENPVLGSITTCWRGCCGGSPGDSPARGDLDHGTGKPFPPPTAGKQHPRLEYPDTGGFWHKVRTLGRAILDHDCTMGGDALALCGTLNL